MSDVSRRDVVKMVAGMGIVATTGVGVIATRDTGSEAATTKEESTSKRETAQKQATAKKEENKKKIDEDLKSALANPSRFMFLEQVTFKTPHPNRAFLFTSAYSNPEGDRKGVRLRPGRMQVFRAIADQDEFTRQGGVHWKNNKTTGKIQFKHPGALVLAVYDLNGTVNCFSLMYNFEGC